MKRIGVRVVVEVLAFFLLVAALVVLTGPHEPLDCPPTVAGCFR